MLVADLTIALASAFPLRAVAVRRVAFLYFLPYAQGYKPIFAVSQVDNHLNNWLREVPIVKTRQPLFARVIRQARAL